jgi:hypothetical protein
VKPGRVVEVGDAEWRRWLGDDGGEKRKHRRFLGLDSHQHSN